MVQYQENQLEHSKYVTLRLTCLEILKEGVLFRVLQRNRTNGREKERERDLFKEVTHTIMEADKSQDPQGELASWNPRRVDGRVLV